MVEAGEINLGEEVVPRTAQRMRLNRNSGQLEEQTEAYLHGLRGCAKFCMNTDYGYNATIALTRTRAGAYPSVGGVCYTNHTFLMAPHSGSQTLLRDVRTNVW